MELVFQNPVQQTGLNATFRLGTKWASRVSPGETIVMVDGNGRECGRARVAILYICQCVDIPMMLLKLGHDPETHTLRGLMRVMNRPAVYDGQITSDSVITTIVYEVIS